MQPRRLVLALVLVSAVLAPGCKKDEKAGGATASRTDVRQVDVTVMLDDKILGERFTIDTLPLDHLATGVPPVEKWIALEGIDRAGKVHTVLAPAKNQAGKIPSLRAGAKGADLGFVGTGGFEPMASDVTRVTIKTKTDAGKPIEVGGHGEGDSGGSGDHGGGANAADRGVRATPTADLKIEVETAGGTSTFTGDKMVGLPEIKAPSGDVETPGWNLVDVLAAAGLKDAKVVVLTDEANATLRIEAGDWDPANTLHYLKLNKSGQIRFRTFRKTGDLWEVAGELRGITRIKVP